MGESRAPEIAVWLLERAYDTHAAHEGGEGGEGGEGPGPEPELEREGEGSSLRTRSLAVPEPLLQPLGVARAHGGVRIEAQESARSRLREALLRMLSTVAGNAPGVHARLLGCGVVACAVMQLRAALEHVGACHVESGAGRLRDAHTQHSVNLLANLAVNRVRRRDDGVV